MHAGQVELSELRRRPDLKVRPNEPPTRVSHRCTARPYVAHERRGARAARDMCEGHPRPLFRRPDYDDLQRSAARSGSGGASGSQWRLRCKPRCALSAFDVVKWNLLDRQKMTTSMNMPILLWGAGEPEQRALFIQNTRQRHSAGARRLTPQRHDAGPRVPQRCRSTLAGTTAAASSQGTRFRFARTMFRLFVTPSDPIMRRHRADLGEKRESRENCTVTLRTRMRSDKDT
jgi:hypothetical protein